jgi:glutamate:Na+ symporter, ESS family
MENQFVEYQIDGVRVLTLSILVLWLGVFLTNRVRFLKDFNIPAPVSGGIVFSLFTLAIFLVFNVQVGFDLQLRDLLLVVFFSTIGLSAKLKLLARGGVALAIMLVLASVFLLLQDLVGIALASLFGVHPAFGLMAGSVSFAGGHGTAIAYGDIFAANYGLDGIAEAGLACATFGLIAGGLVGGPLAKRLIQKYDLHGDTTQESHTPSSEDESKVGPISTNSMIDAVFALGICIGAGGELHTWLEHCGIIFPGFLTSMFVGIALTNLIDFFKIETNVNAVGLMSDFSLQIFLSMSLMSMQLWTLSGALGSLLLVLTCQVVLICLFTSLIVFRIMGNDYDSCVISAGFVGLGLGATPVGIANMRALTSKFGASPKAFLVIPLIGAFFIDIVNLFVIKFYMSLPFFG